MSTIDNRVVQMSFDNVAFEKKIADTIASIDKLKASLDFANAKKGVADLSSAASNFNMGGMTSAIEGVSSKFLALSTIAITVLASITAKAFDAGVSIVKAFSLDPIIGGFREMETNMNSIQTILANTDSKGSTLEDVNTALAQLNEYSDQTIYNFSQMARNIGTFTAAGVDLDTSVGAIKGIANVAAISGSNAEQASTAMYQLSQALATGTVKLIDWNSVVNAGMGGEVFQKALFETGKALGTIADTPINTTFDEWTAAGNSFRGSLETGWLTAEVLTNTLQGFTGDLTEAQLLSLGYTQEQAKEMMRLGDLGKAAATEVKTLTQLLGTVKESVGSGWAKTFQIVIGDFEQAKELFTGINDVIGEFVGANADARNALLQGWADLGGRTALIESMKNVFVALGDVLGPIQKAFREIFPPLTAERLFELTQKFQEFTQSLRLNEDQMDSLKNIFVGVFSGIKIGIEVVKGIIGVFADLFQHFTGGQAGSVVADVFTKISNSVQGLYDVLVTGGGLDAFFDKVTESIINLGEKIKNPMDLIDDLKTRIFEFFEGSNLPDGISVPLDRITDRFSSFYELAKKIANFIQNVFSAVWNGLTAVLGPVGDALDAVFEVMKEWFGELGEKLKAASEPGDFSAVLDIVNVGLLGGLVILFKKFLNGGVGVDFGGGLMKTLTKTVGSIDRTFGQLTNTLSAMQTEIKANALLKIAGAIALLTASVTVLSLIDSASLTKALTAMSVGFGQLIGAMTLLSKLSLGIFGAGGLVVIAVGMIAVAGAILILSLAVRTMAGLEWDELAKGLTGVTGLLLALVGVSKLLQGSSVSMIAAGVGMAAIAVALNILAVAMKIFATMSWEEMGKGLAAVAGSLVAIAIGMQLMPGNMILQGAGLLAIATAMNILAGAMKIFATMSWKDMAKGLVGVSGGLLGIALAMQLMPKGMVLQAAAILVISGALNVLALALKAFAKMSWKEIGKGLATMAGSLLILALATSAMTSSIPGAIAITLVSASLLVLAAVLKEFAKMSLKELGKGLLGISAVLVTLGLTALVIQPLVPALLALGLALFAVGAGFALFGVGASLVASAFGVLAVAGKAGIDTLMYAIDQLLVRLPDMAEAFGIALAEMALTFVQAAPPLVTALGVLLQHILETIRNAIPDLTKTFIEFMTAGLKAIRELFPDVVATGLALLIALLTGIRDNIGEVTTLVIEIIVAFVKAVTAEIPNVVDAAIDLLLAFVGGITDRLGDVITAGVDIVVALLQGISDNLGKIISAAVEVLTTFITEIGKGYLKIVNTGLDMIIDLIQGIGNGASKVVKAATDTVVAFLEGLDDQLIRLVDAGFEFVINLLNGIADSIRENAPELRAAGYNIASAIIDGLTDGLKELAAKPLNAAKKLAGDVLGAIKNPLGIFSPSKAMIEVGGFIVTGLAMGLEDSREAEDSAANMSNRVAESLKASLSRIPTEIDGMSDFNPVITPVLDLTLVRTEARKLTDVLGRPSLAASFSTSQAKGISSEVNARQEDLATTDTVVTGPTEIKFEQNNYSPEALSTADIYRQTKNQIAMAKEELAVA